jgi:hypothetical protein
VSNSVNVTSANRIADATQKGTICINVSAAFNSIIAVVGEDHVNNDLGGGGTTALVLAGVQSEVPKAVCTGSQAWIQTYRSDGHRTSDATTVLVIMH